VATKPHVNISDFLPAGLMRLRIFSACKECIFTACKE
jgi:hypothetical protein